MNPDLIPERDIQTEGLYLSEEELDQEAADWDYWQEVRDCCGGANFWCAHYRQYLPRVGTYRD